MIRVILVEQGTPQGHDDLDNDLSSNTNTNYKYTKLTCLSEEVVLPSGLPHRCHCSTEKIGSHKLFSNLHFLDEIFNDN